MCFEASERAFQLILQFKWIKIWWRNIDRVLALHVFISETVRRPLLFFKVVFMKIGGSRKHRRRDKDVLYYGISDFSIGGRCRCNGHASKCSKNARGRMACECKHHTSGVNCEKCADFYQDRPWSRATTYSANECRGNKVIYQCTLN